MIMTGVMSIRKIVLKLAVTAWVEEGAMSMGSNKYGLLVNGRGKLDLS